MGNGHMHLAAQLDSGSLRVTTKLQCVEVLRGIVITESGSSYRLCAPPEEDELLRPLIDPNALRSLLMISGDVSQAVWNAIDAGTWPAGSTALLPSPQ